MHVIASFQRSVLLAHGRISSSCIEGRRNTSALWGIDLKSKIPSVCIDFLGKLTEKVVNSDYMISGHLETDHKYKQAASTQNMVT